MVGAEISHELARLDKCRNTDSSGRSVLHYRAPSKAVKGVKLRLRARFFICVLLHA